MKGLVHIPGPNELKQAYELLQSARASQSGNQKISVSQLALWTQWSRFDARLGEQWIEYISAHWSEISATDLGEQIRSHPWPAAAGALLEQAREFVVRAPDQSYFRKWAELVLHGVLPAHNEQFMVGVRAFGGKLMRADAEWSLEVYRKWGFLGRDLLINKANVKVQDRTLLPAEFRRKILDELIQQRPRIRVQDYLEAAQGLIGRRQAQLDLMQHPRLMPCGGMTRGRYFQRRRGRDTGE